MTDVEAAELRAELSSLSDRVRRLERRIDALEPETQRGPGPESFKPPGESRMLDAIGDLFEAFGSGGQSGR